MGKNITIIIAIVAALLVITGIWFSWQAYSTPVVVGPVDQNGEVADITQAGEENTNNQDGSGSTTAKLSYTAAVKLYTDRRIQFDSKCVATPNNASFKEGTVIMLDNRGTTAQKISVGGVVYTIGAYDYRVVTLSTTAQLPVTLNIDCGTGQQNARILLQQ